MSIAYHIELPFVLEQTTFDRFERASSICGLQVRNTRRLDYVDEYWDTKDADLHASSMAVRARRRPPAEVDQLNFKGPPRYVAPFLFARPLINESVSSSQAAVEALRGQRPSQTLASLYETRADLAGRPLQPIAEAFISRQNVDLHDSRGEGVCTLSFHRYRLMKDSQAITDGYLLEVQPFCRSPIVSAAMIRVFEVVHNRLTAEGCVASPIGKYHRIPRGMLEQPRTQGYSGQTAVT